MLNLTTSGALASFEVRNQSYTPRSTTCPPNFVPPGDTLAPTLTPTPTPTLTLTLTLTLTPTPIPTPNP